MTSQKGLKEHRNVHTSRAGRAAGRAQTLLLGRRAQEQRPLRLQLRPSHPPLSPSGTAGHGHIRILPCVTRSQIAFRYPDSCLFGKWQFGQPR